MDEPENKNFSEFLAERTKARGWNAKRLSEVSGISLKHIEGLLRGNFDILPSTPYLHGYIERLGRLFGFDPEGWWQKIKAENEIKDSGASDKLPQNRFLKRSRSKFVWLGVAGVVVVIYLGFQLAHILGKPTLSVTYPGDELTNTASSELAVGGTVKNADEVQVNGETASVSADGSWKKNVLLQPGLNTIEVTAKKFLGREVNIVRQVFYQPAASSSVSTTSPALR